MTTFLFISVFDAEVLTYFFCAHIGSGYRAFQVGNSCCIISFIVTLSVHTLNDACKPSCCIYDILQKALECDYSVIVEVMTIKVKTAITKAASFSHLELVVI